MILVQDLFKRFGPFEALKFLSFEVGAGEAVGLLGENGAGKTTTMRILSCFLPPTSGTVQIAGHDIIFDSVAVRRSIGYMPESVPLYGNMRVEEFVRFRARLKGVSGRDAKAATARALDRVQMTDRRRSLIQTLSKGLRQRVGLAEALVHDPALLILDEPTSGLDPSQRRGVRQLIRELRDHHTVLVSSHILPEIEDTCQRAVVIHAGTVVAQKSIEEMKASGGGGSFIAMVRGTEAEIRAAMATVPDADVIEVSADGDRVRLEVRTADAEHGRERAVAALVGRGIGVHEVRASAGSLEDAFVRLIGGDKE